MSKKQPVTALLLKAGRVSKWKFVSLINNNKEVEFVNNVILTLTNTKKPKSIIKLKILILGLLVGQLFYGCNSSTDVKAKESKPASIIKNDSIPPPPPPPPQPPQVTRKVTKKK